MGRGYFSHQFGRRSSEPQRGTNEVFFSAPSGAGRRYDAVVQVGAADPAAVRGIEPRSAAAAWPNPTVRTRSGPSFPVNHNSVRNIYVELIRVFSLELLFLQQTCFFPIFGISE